MDVSIRRLFFGPQGNRGLGISQAAIENTTMTPTGPMAGIAISWSCQWGLICSCRCRLWGFPVGPAAWASTQSQTSCTFRCGNHFCVQVVKIFFVAKLTLKSLLWIWLCSLPLSCFVILLITDQTIHSWACQNWDLTRVRNFECMDWFH